MTGNKLFEWLSLEKLYAHSQLELIVEGASAVTNKLTGGNALIAVQKRHEIEQYQTTIIIAFPIYMSCYI